MLKESVANIVTKNVANIVTKVSHVFIIIYLQNSHNSLLLNKSCKFCREFLHVVQKLQIGNKRSQQQKFVVILQ